MVNTQGATLILLTFLTRTPIYLSVVYGLVWLLEWMPKDISLKEIVCLNYDNHFKFNGQHNWGAYMTI